ncbi:hypothetical protein ACLB2K_060864 [Fragaria x ananassa]
MRTQVMVFLDHQLKLRRKAPFHVQQALDIHLLQAFYLQGYQHQGEGSCSGSMESSNPAIKDFKILPKQQCLDGAINSMAFGYDPKSKDYKVLDIVDPTGERIGEDRLVFSLPKVEVYTSSTNSWREIENYSLETETTLFLPMFHQMFMNGVCYWIGCERQKEFMDLYDRNDEEWARQVINTFDTSNEVFDHILFPYSLYDLNARYFHMHVIPWNESIARFGMYSFGALFTTDSYGLWVLNNLGDIHEGSWTKLLTLDVLLGMQKELVFWKSDEILMVAKDGRIFTHNIETERFRYVPIDSLFPDNCEAVVCVNSIVPVTLEKQQA